MYIRYLGHINLGNWDLLDSKQGKRGIIEVKLPFSFDAAHIFGDEVSYLVQQVRPKGYGSAEGPLGFFYREYMRCSIKSLPCWLSTVFIRLLPGI